MKRNATPFRSGLASMIFVLAVGASAKDRTAVPWSFKPLFRPELPAVKDANWQRDPLDRFILSKLEAKTLAPNKDADRITLIRRASFDLVGLPPTPQEIEAFVRDSSNDDQAFAKVVDNLLKSPRFGERWARHWLDVVRYSDSVGRTMNAAFPFARRYRDYVIDAFNKDKPYNRFIGEQVAGDLLPVPTPDERAENVIATGMLTMASLDLSEGGEMFRLDQVDDQIDVTTRAFLGLTMSCARCHSHKTDPISQADYYSLAGIFYSTETLQGQRPKGDLGANGYVDEEALVRVPAANKTSIASNGSKSQSAAAGNDDDSAMMDMNQGKGYPVYYRYDPTRAMGVTEGEVQDCAIAIKGDPFNRGDAPKRGEFQLPSLPKLPSIPEKSSGRLELVKWLTLPNHPLTARVMVNRIWQHLLGRGIVRSVDDFGITGDAPTHPDLLDHLAVRFVENGWSVKKLIRSIMLSRTYRMSSQGDAAKENADGPNDLFWRMNLRRLEAEAIRDSMFFVAGEISYERPKGTQVAGFGGKGRNSWLRSLTPEDAPYRAVYLPALRSMMSPMQETFDFPDPSQIKGQREVTTVSPQALFFLNGDLAASLAKSTAVSLLEEKLKDDAARVAAAYMKVLGRKPDAAEVTDAIQMMKELSSKDQTSRWAILIQALMSSAEFRYVL
jgi:cytochrome c553